MKFSASLLNTWMTCPLQAKFQYEDNLPRQQNAKASFGTCIHKALETYNKTNDYDLAIEEFKDYWKNPGKLGVDPDYWPKRTTYSGLRERGLEILKQYHDKNLWLTREVIVAEHPFCVPIGDHELSGVVDCLELTKAGNGRRTLRVIDYKTNSKKPGLDMLRYNIQFTVYAYASSQIEFWTGVPDTKYVPIENGAALFESFRSVTRKPIWYHLWTNQEIDAGPRDDGDYERLYRLLDQIEKAVTLGAYIPTINEESCTFCSFTDQCRFVIPVKNQIKLENQEEEEVASVVGPARWM